MANLGYAALLLQSNAATDGVVAVELLVRKLGVLMVSLAVLHFANMYVFYRIRRRATASVLPPPVAPQVWCPAPRNVAARVIATSFSPEGRVAAALRSPTRLLVLYDADCALCIRCRHWLEDPADVRRRALPRRRVARGPDRSRGARCRGSASSSSSSVTGARRGWARPASSSASGRHATTGNGRTACPDPPSLPWPSASSTSSRAAARPSAGCSGPTTARAGSADTGGSVGADGAPGPRPRPARAADETRARIVEAALESLHEEGILGASARAIARRGGFNQALIFYHFGSVDELLLAAVDELSARRSEKYEDRLEQVSSLAGLVAEAGPAARRGHGRRPHDRALADAGRGRHRPRPAGPAARALRAVDGDRRAHRRAGPRRLGLRPARPGQGPRLRHHRPLPRPRAAAEPGGRRVAAGARHVRHLRAHSPPSSSPSSTCCPRRSQPRRLARSGPVDE